MRWSFAFLITIGLFQGCGRCSQDQSSGSILAPPEVVVTVGLKSPEQLINNATELLGRFINLPPGMSTMWLKGMLAEELGLDPAILNQVDLGRSFYLVAVDGKRAANTQGQLGVAAVPLVDEGRFFEALGKTHNVSKEKGMRKLAPKSGGTALFAVTAGGYGLLADHAAALQKSRKFVEGLTTQPPKSSVEIRLLLAHMFDEKGEFDNQIKQLVPMLGHQAGLRYLEAIRDAEEVTFAGDVVPEGITIELIVFAKEEGRMRDVIKRQKPVEPFAVDRLSAETWFSLSDYYGPEALAESVADSKGFIGMLTRLSEADRAGLGKDMEKFAGSLEGPLTVSLHSPPPTRNFTVTMLFKAKDSSAAKKALDGIGNRLAEGLKLEINDRGQVKSLEFTPQALGVVAGVGAMNLGVAWAVKNSMAVLAMGSGASDEVATAIAGKRQPNLTSSAFAASAQPRPGRVGLLYFSPLQTARMVAGLFTMGGGGIPQLDEVKETRGVDLDWAVDDARRQISIRLRVPTEAMEALTPIVSGLMGVLGALGGGLGGPPAAPPGLPQIPQMPGPGGGPFQLTPPGSAPATP